MTMTKNELVAFYPLIDTDLECFWFYNIFFRLNEEEHKAVFYADTADYTFSYEGMTIRQFIDKLFETSKQRFRDEQKEMKKNIRICERNFVHHKRGWTLEMYQRRARGRRLHEEDYKGKYYIVRKPIYERLKEVEKGRYRNLVNISLVISIIGKEKRKERLLGKITSLEEKEK